MHFFVAHIGPYPYEKLANVQATGFSGGTEYASAIFYGEKGVSAGRGPVVHEIAHQWFGNSVTERDWDDVWLSEGFATYFTLLFTEHDEGRDAFVDGLKRSRAQIAAARAEAARHAGHPSQPCRHEQGAEQPGVSEGRLGAAHAARGSRHGTFLGRDPRVLPPLSRQNASTAELRAIFEQVSGKPLGWFFTQWLTRPGVPKIEGSWRYLPGRKAVEVTVTQSQAAEPFRLSIDVGITAKAGEPPNVERIELTGRTATKTFNVEGQPASVVIDPNTWLLMEPVAVTKR